MSLKSVLAEREKRQQAREEAPFQTLVLRDGDTALIRFLDDDMYEERKFHTVLQTFPSGKKFTFNIPCVNRCDYCDSPNDDISKQKTKIMAWVYVSSIYHNKADAEGKWVSKKRAGGKLVYVEAVDRVLLFLNSIGNKGALSEQILECYQENGTICDRNFTWTRKGSGQMDTTYILKPGDKSDFDIAVKTPMTLQDAANYLIKSAKTSLSFKSNGNGKTAGKVVEEVSQKVDEATAKALDDIIAGDDEGDGSLF